MIAFIVYFPEPQYFCRTNLRRLFLMFVSPFKWNFTLNHSLFTEPIFRDHSQNICSEISAPYWIWTISTIGEYVASLMFYLFRHKVLQTVINYVEAFQILALWIYVLTIFSCNIVMLNYLKNSILDLVECLSWNINKVLVVFLI